MPPKEKGKDAFKQKSLTSFFAKPTVGASSSQTKTAPKPVVRKSSAMSIGENASSSTHEPHTPETKLVNARALTSSVAASSTSSRAASTPPTSDPIDVDMLSDGEAEGENQTHARSVVSTRLMIIIFASHGSRQVHKKRKIVADSDEDAGPSKQKPSVPNSSPIPAKGACSHVRCYTRLTASSQPAAKGSV
jgi:DNA mismatch repair protein MSH6